MHCRRSNPTHTLPLSRRGQRECPQAQRPRTLDAHVAATSTPDAQAAIISSRRARRRCTGRHAQRRCRSADGADAHKDGVAAPIRRASRAGSTHRPAPHQLDGHAAAAQTMRRTPTQTARTPARTAPCATQARRARRRRNDVDGANGVVVPPTRMSLLQRPDAHVAAAPRQTARTRVTAMTPQRRRDRADTVRMPVITAALHLPDVRAVAATTRRQLASPLLTRRVPRASRRVSRDASTRSRASRRGLSRVSRRVSKASRRGRSRFGRRELSRVS